MHGNSSANMSHSTRTPLHGHADPTAMETLVCDLAIVQELLRIPKAIRTDVYGSSFE